MKIPSPRRNRLRRPLKPPEAKSLDYARWYKDWEAGVNTRCVLAGQGQLIGGSPTWIHRILSLLTAIIKILTIPPTMSELFPSVQNLFLNL